MSKINEFFLTNRRRLMTQRIKSKIDVSDVSIISMNCIGGVLYHDLSQRFLTPTVNLFFSAGDFIKFVSNLDYYLSITPVVVMNEKYPVGTLDDIKIHFMHYDNSEDALNKWEIRKKRINKDKIFVIMTEQNGFTKEHFEMFKHIKYPKILFAKTKEFEYENSLYFSKYKNYETLPDIIPGRYMYNKMKLINLIKKAFE